MENGGAGGTQMDLAFGAKNQSSENITALKSREIYNFTTNFTTKTQIKKTWQLTYLCKENSRPSSKSMCPDHTPPAYTTNRHNQGLKT